MKKIKKLIIKVTVFFIIYFVIKELVSLILYLIFI